MNKKPSYISKWIAYPSYKDSKVEWLGEVPKSWGLKRIKHIAKCIQTGTTPPSSEDDYYINGNINWYSPSDFNDEIILNPSLKKITMKACQSNSARIFEKPSILLVSIGTIGKVALATTQCSSNQQI